MTGFVLGVALLKSDRNGQLEPVVLVPGDGVPGKSLMSAVEAVVSQGQAVGFDTSSDPDQIHVFAAPLVNSSGLIGVVAVEAGPFTDPESFNHQKQHLEWQLKSLLKALHQRDQAQSSMSTVLQLLASSLQHESFKASATAVATELATDLGFERVAIGFLKGKQISLQALSHSASFSAKANFSRSLESAMEEAVDQYATVSWPPVDLTNIQITRAHETLAKEQNDTGVFSIPLKSGDRIAGALLCEVSAADGLNDKDIEFCEHVAALIGPLLEVKRRDDRWIGAKIADSLKGLLRRLVGPRHTGLKLATGLLVFLVIFFSLATGDFRVTSDARIEGSVQRAIAVPYSGFVVEAMVRAGDEVSQDDVLFTLDDRDLRLEKLKWESQRLQSSREYSEANADRDRARARILSAQVEQAESEIALLDEQLARTLVRAPFDGVIVSGDLSQQLGSPVERGEVLFELAPLDSYRVVMEVDERDILELQEGQSGLLALASNPDQGIPLLVERITPLSTTQEGKNFFRVEAAVAPEYSVQLRPGMEGIAKVSVERRKLIWIWTYKITHWLRMFFWSWWP